MIKIIILTVVLVFSIKSVSGVAALSSIVANFGHMGSIWATDTSASIKKLNFIMKEVNKLHKIVDYKKKMSKEKIDNLIEKLNESMRLANALKDDKINPAAFPFNAEYSLASLVFDNQQSLMVQLFSFLNLILSSINEATLMISIKETSHPNVIDIINQLNNVDKHVETATAALPIINNIGQRLLNDLNECVALLTPKKN